MSSSKYPLLAARWRAVVGGLVLALGTHAVGSVIGATGVTLQSTNSAVGGYASASSFTLQSSSPRIVRFDFTNFLLFGGEFVNLSALASGQQALGGTLLSVAINASVSNTEGPDSNGDETWASDLTILVAPSAAGSPNTYNGGSPINLLLQVGGTTGFETGVSGASTFVERTLWYPSGDPNEYLSANTSYSISSSLTLANSPTSSDPVVWLGHGFTTSVGANFGTWTGYVDFTFAGSGGSGVPDVSRTALLLAPGTLLLLGLAGRSRRRG